MRDRARGKVLPVLVLLVAVLAGCSSIPSSGPVHEGRDLQLERGDSALRVIGQPPVKGASPQDVVRGFLQASADFVNDHATARLYLAPAVRQRWQPSTGTAVYDRSAAATSSEGPFSLDVARDGTVNLSAAEVARMDAEGHYARSAPGTTLRRTFRMTKVDGEWRISALADGLVLTRGDIQETYRQVNLYFLAPSRTVLVPDTVFLPAEPGLSTTLVNRLLRGPSRSLRGVVTTAFPQGTSLSVSSVPVRDGVARVSLDPSALDADPDSRERMSAQLVWTLKQLPEIQAVRVTANGESLAVRGVPEDQPRDAWSAYDPAGLTQGSIAYVVRHGRVGRVVDGKFTPVAGPAGDGREPVQRPGVSLDAAQLAAISPDGRTLLLGRLLDEGPLTARFRGGDLSAPSWDPAGNIWVADRSDGRLWLVPPGRGKPVQVEVPRLEAGRITTVRVARDGTRVALVAGAGSQAHLYVGSVVHEPQERVGITGVYGLLPELHAVRDIAWGDATTLAVLGRLGDQPSSPLFTDTDGYNVTPIEQLPNLATLAAAPGPRPLLAADASGTLQQYTVGRGWVKLGDGTDPTYPG